MDVLGNDYNSHEAFIDSRLNLDKVHSPSDSNSKSSSPTNNQRRDHPTASESSRIASLASKNPLNSLESYDPISTPSTHPTPSIQIHPIPDPKISNLSSDQLITTKPDPPISASPDQITPKSVLKTDPSIPRFFADKITPKSSNSPISSSWSLIHQPLENVYEIYREPSTWDKTSHVISNLLNSNHVGGRCQYNRLPTSLDRKPPDQIHTFLQVVQTSGDKLILFSCIICILVLSIFIFMPSSSTSAAMELILPKPPSIFPSHSSHQPLEKQFSISSHRPTVKPSTSPSVTSSTRAPKSPSISLSYSSHKPLEKDSSISSHRPTVKPTTSPKTTCSITSPGSGCSNYRAKSLKDFTDDVYTPEKCYALCDQKDACGGFFIRPSDSGCFLYRKGCKLGPNPNYDYYEMKDCIGAIETAQALTQSSEANEDTIPVQIHTEQHATPSSVLGLSYQHTKKFDEFRSKDFQIKSSNTRGFDIMILSTWIARHVWKSGGSTIEKQFDVEQVSIKKNILSTPMFAVVRDPIEHFLSGRAHCCGFYYKESTGLSLKTCDAEDYIASWIRKTKTGQHWSQHSNPQVTFLVEKSGDIFENLRMIVDISEMKSFMEEELKRPFDESKGIAMTADENPWKRKYRLHKEDLDDHQLLKICKFVAMDYCAFAFEFPKPCEGYLNKFCDSH